jgi:hypothetical protein
MPKNSQKKTRFSEWTVSSGRFVFLSPEKSINPTEFDFHGGVRMTSANVAMGAVSATEPGLHCLQRGFLAVAPEVRGIVPQLVRTSWRDSFSRGGVSLWNRLGAVSASTPPRSPFTHAAYGEGASC